MALLVTGCYACGVVALYLTFRSDRSFSLLFSSLSILLPLVMLGIKALLRIFYTGTWPERALLAGVLISIASDLLSWLANAVPLSLVQIGPALWPVGFGLIVIGYYAWCFRTDGDAGEYSARVVTVAVIMGLLALVSSLIAVLAINDIFIHVGEGLNAFSLQVLWMSWIVFKLMYGLIMLMAAGSRAWHSRTGPDFLQLASISAYFVTDLIQYNIWYFYRTNSPSLHFYFEVSIIKNYFFCLFALGFLASDSPGPRPRIEARP